MTHRVAEPFRIREAISGEPQLYWNRTPSRESLPDRSGNSSAVGAVPLAIVVLMTILQVTLFTPQRASLEQNRAALFLRNQEFGREAFLRKRPVLPVRETAMSLTLPGSP